MVDQQGPSDPEGPSRLVALPAIIGCILLIVGAQPPNEKVGRLLALGVLVLLAIWYPKLVVVVFALTLDPLAGDPPVILLALGWFAEEQARFQGPPLTEEAVKARQAEIAREEAAMRGAG